MGLLDSMFGGGTAVQLVLDTDTASPGGVVGGKVRTDSGGNRFFADIGVASAMNKATGVTPRKLFFGDTDQLHRAVEISGVWCHHLPG